MNLEKYIMCCSWQFPNSDVFCFAHEWAVTRVWGWRPVKGSRADCAAESGYHGSYLDMGQKPGTSGTIKPLVNGCLFIFPKYGDHRIYITHPHIDGFRTCWWMMAHKNIQELQRRWVNRTYLARTFRWFSIYFSVYVSVYYFIYLFPKGICLQFSGRKKTCCLLLHSLLSFPPPEIALQTPWTGLASRVRIPCFRVPGWIFFRARISMCGAFLGFPGSLGTRVGKASISMVAFCVSCKRTAWAVQRPSTCRIHCSTGNQQGQPAILRPEKAWNVDSWRSFRALRVSDLVLFLFLGTDSCGLYAFVGKRPPFLPIPRVRIWPS